MSATLVEPYPFWANRRSAVNTMRSRVSGAIGQLVERSFKSQGAVHFPHTSGDGRWATGDRLHAVTLPRHPYSAPSRGVACAFLCSSRRTALVLRHARWSAVKIES